MRETIFKGFIVSITLLSAVSGWAVNKKTTVSQVTTAVTLSDDVDYIISSETPFTENGVVNITNTEHGVLILSEVRPSSALSLLSKHVQVNGVRAVNNSNCQVKLYNQGCIILPYSQNLKPLTVFSEPNFEGESCNDFGLESSGGYMNTLTAAKLNNKIRSFKLKRGYMVTFSNKPGGRGYSRCFIAAYSDLEIANMPAVLDRSISSYRVFKWYDTGKKQIANEIGNEPVLNALNVQSSYDWGQGNASKLPDYEWVPNHIYEDWPSSSTIGSATQSPHTKNNNEPRNSADDHPQDLNTILANWENMMRTGMRLCSPASWDGSDYDNATGFLAQFLDSIDARSWRCDIIDLHCYWPESKFNNLHNWSDKYKRPIWISEWCWGASWNSNGAFANGVTQSQVKDALTNICTKLNGWNYVERYYYWNGDGGNNNMAKLYTDKLTPAGEYYANMNSGLAYSGSFDYAPPVPKQYDPSDLVLVYDVETQKAKLTWKEYNGEFNSGQYIECRQSERHPWETIADVPFEEYAADYEYVVEGVMMGNQYRIHVVDGKGDDRYTKFVTAASSDLGTGNAVKVNDETKYLGGNIFINGDFDMGFYGWKNGKGESLSSDYFQVVHVGSIDGGSYLQSYGNGSFTTESAILTAFDVEPNSDYYFSGVSCNTPKTMQQVQLSPDGKELKDLGGFLFNSTSNWLSQYSVFNTKDYSKVVVAFRSLGGTSGGKYIQAQVDKLQCFRLFDTPEAAYADGVEKMRLAATAFQDYNTLYPAINTDLQNTVAGITGKDKSAYQSLLGAVKSAKTAYSVKQEMGELKPYVEKLLSLKLPGYENLSALFNALENGTLSTIQSAKSSFEEALNAYFSLTYSSDNISQPSFENASGWTVKAGTYTGGDQRVNSKDDVSFWNAWWSGLSSDEGTGKTMEIKQKIDGLSHGLYTIQCAATTEHYCLSDQHGYITDGTVTENTTNLKANYFDLPLPKEYRWETLSSAPIYVPEDGSVTIGFLGSKAGAVDKAWAKLGNEPGTGDQREGWWCATDFKLGFHPLYRITVVPNQWNVICLPYSAKATEGVKFYEIAGITEDLQSLGLREIQEANAGVPFIYKSENADVTFFEYGEKVDRTTDGKGNLRGFFKVTSKVPTNYFFLTDGVWKKVGDDRPKMSSFTGIIRPFADKNSVHVGKLVGWTGETMPIEGVTAEDYAAGISPVTSSAFTEDGIYTLDGRAIDKMQMRHGIYVRVESGKISKVIKK